FFRPTDAATVLGPVGIFMAATLLRQPIAPRRRIATLAAFAAGIAVPLLLLLAAHVAIFGFAQGAYLALSAKYGFTWALIPMRWATLVVDPKPLLAEGWGLARLFPWIPFGIAGMGLYMAGGDRGRTSRHLLIGSTLIVLWLQYLAYVDLQPYGLWRFSNY